MKLKVKTEIKTKQEFGNLIHIKRKCLRKKRKQGGRRKARSFSIKSATYLVKGNLRIIHQNVILLKTNTVRSGLMRF
jgi:hypothetical protein